MKNIFKIIFLITTLGMISACEKFLDLKPENFLSPVNYFNTEEQLNFALNGVYDILGKGPLYGNLIPVNMATEADEGFYARQTTVSGPTVFNFSSSDANILNLWTNLYDGINRANVVLVNVDNAKIDEVKRGFIIGEALFLRAYYYFLLVINWGDVPLLLQPTSSAIGNNVQRTSVEEIYEQIIKDMETAEGLVRTAQDAGFGGRINKSAVRGILARVNLHWAGYPVRNLSRYAEALKWTKKIIDDKESQHKLNPSYEQIFINYAQDKYDIAESIWEVEFWGNGIGSAFNEHGQIGSWIGITTLNPSIGTAYGFINATYRHYLRYDTDDLRRDYAIAPFRYEGTTTNKIYFEEKDKYVRNVGKWRRENETLTPKGYHNTPQNYPLLRYADVLLMFAEADNVINSGPSVEAYRAINQVRRRAYGISLDAISSEIDFKNMDQGTFLAAIQEERSRELCFEGLRKHDLIRWGILIPTLKQVASEVNANAENNMKYAALRFNNVSTRHLLLPIPESELALNNLLTQNPEW